MLIATSATDITYTDRYENVRASEWMSLLVIATEVLVSSTGGAYVYIL